MRLRADRYAGSFTTSNLAANLVAIFLIDALKMFVEGGDVGEVNGWCRFFNGCCGSSCTVRCECAHEHLVCSVGTTQASEIERRCVGIEMRDKRINSAGALCTGEINQHRCVINVIRGSQVAHAIRAKHEREIGAECASRVVDRK